MRFTLVPDFETLSQRAAEIIRGAAQERADMLLCAPSGDTPTRTYELLSDAPTDLARIRVLKLDEWAGLAMSDPATCESYLQRHILGPLAVPLERYLSFRSDATDPEAECRRVDTRLEAEGPVDLCLLGLGRNGHIAMNEPAASLAPGCHVATLSESTRRHPMLADAHKPVTHGLTLGMASILQARRVVLLVSGRHKRTPLKRLCARQISPRFPASFLWLHADAECLCDFAAANGIVGSLAQDSME